MKLLLTALLTVCTTLPLAAQMHPADMAGPKVLLAYEQTSFKKQLITEMKKTLAISGIDITIAVYSKKNKLEADPAGYAAVFISNSGVNSKVRPWIAEWLEANKNYAQKIILHTTQRSNWNVKTIDGVDAVTSASAEDKVRDLALEYSGHIMKMLMPAPPPRPVAE